MLLNRCIAFLLLLAFGAMSFSQAVVEVNFFANQDSIAKTLCENRDKPMMHCNGRCQLCKRLAKQDNQDKDNPERKAENRNEVLFCQETGCLLTQPSIYFISSLYFAMTSGEPVDRASAIFHPPAAC